MNNKYETVIGLEVHVQLSTRTKVFCGCSTEFGAPPNTHVCPVCLGLPGVLPVFNRKAFECAIKVALALDSDIQGTMKFDRKNYYYPDLPKNYQISQFDMPLAYNGKLIIDMGDGAIKEIGITRAHMEEDAGKLLHSEEGKCSYVDLNRTGTPLLEIVSEPEINSPQEAYAYLTTLKQVIKYLGVSDCNMEEGSLRCDANISLREKGASALGSKVEIKNLNSFKAVMAALAYEEGRQADILGGGEKIAQETRLWDEDAGVTLSMRTKEEAHDYKYFPEPDLVPFEISPELIKGIRGTMPELPRAKQKRFEREYGLDRLNTEVMISERETADFFEKVAGKTGDAQTACNWIKGEVMMHMNERGAAISDLRLSPDHLADIIDMSKGGKISNLAAKDVLRTCLETGKAPSEIVREKGLEQVSDTDALGAVIDQVISGNERSVNDFRNGKENALSFLIGQAMRISKGRANPKVVGDILREKLKG